VPYMLVLLLMLVPCLAQAGAWPRDKGAVFLSLSQDVARRPGGGLSSTQSLYLEYGVTETLTFGVKANRNADGLTFDVLSFTRMSLGNPDAANKFAVELALGGRWNILTGYEAVVQPALHWGRGFTAPAAISFLGNGWMGVEASLGHGFFTQQTWAKADFTLGFTPADETHLILQLRSHHDRFGSSYSVAPSFVRRFSRALKLEIGGLWHLSGNEPPRLRAATWIEF